jgi:septum site-determining protein MinD
VLVVADIGLRNLDVVMGLENRIVFHLVDAVQGRCTLQKALIRDRRIENLYLLPASQTDDKDSVTPEQMKALIIELKASYEYVLIDCPAGIEQGFRNAIAGADEAIIVATPEVASIRDADRVVGLLAAQGTPTRLMVNRIAPHMVKRGDMLSQADVIEILALELVGAIPLDDEIVATTNKGLPAALNGRRHGPAPGRRRQRDGARDRGRLLQPSRPRARSFAGLTWLTSRRRLTHVEPDQESFHQRAGLQSRGGQGAPAPGSRL